MTHICFTGHTDTSVHWIQSVLIFLSSLHRCSAYRCYSCMHGFSILIIWILVPIACMIVPGYSRSYYMYYCAMLPSSCYMIVSCYWYGYSRYWTWELLIGDMWNPTSIVPGSCYIVHDILFPLYCSRFPLYCSTLSTELWSSYHVTRIMYSSCSCYIVYLTYQIIKLTWVWGRLNGWLDLIGWCTGSILFSHCRGR